MTVQMFGEVAVQVGPDHIAEVELRRPPNNFVSIALLHELANAYEALDADPACRVILLCSEGKHFSAGAEIDPASDSPLPRLSAGGLYESAVRIFGAKKPVVAAVQGAAVGAGLGLACAADFRVAAPEARFSANFAQLGFHHGFGLSVSLPLLVGHTHALDILYTGRRVGGEEAHAMGLCTRLVPLADVRAEARRFAADIATSAPLAVQAIRQTMRGHLAEEVRVATLREGEQQIRLRATNDFAEGIKAVVERRPANFTGT